MAAAIVTRKRECPITPAGGRAPVRELAAEFATQQRVAHDGLQEHAAHRQVPHVHELEVRLLRQPDRRQR